jgi:hypothetical protein
MASVTLDRVWLHDWNDLSVYETFWSAKPGDQRQKAGEVRAYAGGRLRNITRALRKQTLAVRLVDVTVAQLDVLDGWLGTDLMYRDETGLLLPGTFHDLDADTYPFGQGYEVSFTFQQITASIEV